MANVFTDANFDQEVLKSPIPVVVDFWAEWCGPCRMMSPIVEELGDELDASKLKVGKLNVDESGETAQKYSVMSIPTFIVFKDGKVIEQIVGSMSKAALQDKLSKHLL